MLLAANREGRDIVKPAGLLGGLVKASHQNSGLTEVPSGCLACPNRTCSPVAASVMRTFVDWVDVSTPATSTLVMHSSSMRVALKSFGAP